jgi:hypothetical protein
LVKALVLHNSEGRVLLSALEYPEDFPPGKYYYLVENESAKVPGAFDKLEIEVNIYGVGGLEALKKQKKK